MKNVYEVAVGIGSAIRYYHATSEEEVIERVKIDYPELRRYKDLTEEEHQISARDKGFKDIYHIHLLSPDVLNRVKDDYDNWVVSLKEKLVKAETFLNQLNYPD
jgi:hypothetical protein